MKNKLFKILLSPFFEYAELTFAIIFISIIPILLITPVKYVIHPITYDIVQTYISVLLISIVALYNAKVAKILSKILLTVTIVGIVIIVFCRCFCGVYDMYKISSIIKGTNFDEANEFFQHYVTPTSLVDFIIAIAAAAVSALILREIYGRFGKTILKSPFYYALSVCFLVGIVVVTSWMVIKKWPPTFEGTPANFLYYGATIFYDDPKIEPYEVDIVPQSTDYKSPENIVVIIGESLSRTHMGIYGYEKPTTPHLSKLMSDSSLIVFQNAKAPATTTADSFKEFMTIEMESKQKYEYYNAPTWITILHSAGYRSIWISNQSKFGAWDNIPSEYGQLCDTTIWADSYYSFGYASKDIEGRYDERLIDLKKSFEENPTKNKPYKLDIYHLMGSHPDFDKRYPKNYVKFIPDDYPGSYNNMRRRQESYYDNSVCYNDSVISEIINIYKNDDAIVIYFSDHALDLYQSSDSYCGHAHAHPEFAEMIPFIIYISDEFRKLRAGCVNKLREKIDQPLSISDLTYMLMDIAGVEIVDSRSPEKSE